MSNNTQKRRGRPAKNKQVGSTEFTPNSNETAPLQEDFKNSFENEVKTGNMSTDQQDSALDAARARRKARREGNAPGANEQKLAATPIEGYQLRWVNDDKDRIQRLIDDGWDLVEKDEVTAYSNDEGNKVSQTVGAGGLKAVLMKQPEEFHQEDLATKRNKVFSRSADAKKAASGQGSLGNSHAYIPNGSNSEFEV